MIYEDEGLTIIEYGHGSIFGISAEQDDEGAYPYGLVSADRNEIGSECRGFKKMIGQPLDTAGPSVVFRFFKRESLKILMEDLQAIHDRMEE